MASILCSANHFIPAEASASTQSLIHESTRPSTMTTMTTSIREGKTNRKSNDACVSRQDALDTRAMMRSWKKMCRYIVKKTGIKAVANITIACASTSDLMRILGRDEYDCFVG